MTTQEIITMAANGKATSEDIRNIANVSTWDECQPLMIQAGKEMRHIANNMDSFITTNIMKEVENCYYEALHADCGYTMHVQLQRAIAWLAKAGVYAATGEFEF